MRVIDFRDIQEGVIFTVVPTAAKFKGHGGDAVSVQVTEPHAIEEAEFGFVLAVDWPVGQGPDFRFGVKVAAVFGVEAE